MVTDKKRDSGRRAFRAELLNVLRCTSCQGRLADDGPGLLCLRCGLQFPEINGVVRFVDKQHYAGSFGFQWHKYARTQLDTADNHDSEIAFRERTGFTPEELRGKLVLDVGCGMGRFAEVASRWGARVVGVDLSSAAEVAARNLAERDYTVFFQADAFALPFAIESFDFIYSVGVLHHTPNCCDAFDALPPLLKRGGTIAIWVYSGYNKWYRFSDFYRRLTYRLPPRLLHKLCLIAGPLFYIHRGLRLLPLVGRPASGLLQLVLPVSLHSNWDARVLDTFDWYSPRYQSKHTYEEVYRWFEVYGLDSLRVLDQPISVRGSKPLTLGRVDISEERCAHAESA